MAIALYARKSVEREHSISCETQLEYCRSALRPDEQQEEILPFVDNGCSGATVNREGFQRMMNAVERGEIRKIIVYRLDRISRSLADFVRILESLKRSGVRFVSSQESFDSASPYGEMILKILMVFAEFERASTVERVTQAYIHRSELGFFMGGRVPYGFSLEDVRIHGVPTKRLCPVEPEAEQIRFLFAKYAQNNLSLRRLAGHLTQNGMFPAAGTWSSAKLSTILRNPVYVRADHHIYDYFARHRAQIVSAPADFDGIHGLQLYGQSKHHATDWSDLRVVRMEHEGIVSADVWLACQDNLERNRKIGTALCNSTSWLGGKLRCRRCGRAMTVTSGRPNASGLRPRYFNCASKTHGHPCPGVAVTLYAQSLEDTVSELIAQKLASLRGLPCRPSDEHAALIRQWKTRLYEIASQQEMLVERLLRDPPEPELLELLNARAARLSEEKRTLNEQLHTLTEASSHSFDPNRLLTAWQTASFDTRKAVGNLLLHRIDVEDNGNLEVVWNL